jgi:Zn-dependent protease/CBS domain-containing protein
MHWSVLVIVALLAEVLAVVTLPADAPGRSSVIYWATATAVAVVFVLTLLAHEISHALVARHYGIRVRRITLWLLGGVAELDGEPPHPRADLLVAVAGPATSAALAGALWAAAHLIGGSGLLAVSLSWLALVNAILAGFNLLPGAPLDGGRVLRALIWWIRGDREAARRGASRAGVWLGVLLAGLGLAELWFGDLGGLWMILLGWFIVTAARAEEAGARLSPLLDSVRVGDVMSSPAVCGYVSETVESFLAATATRHPYRSYPVLDLDGRLAGVVTLADLARLPADRRGRVRLADAQIPLSRLHVLDPSTPLTAIAGDVLAADWRLQPVAVRGRLSGVLTATDVRRSVELAALGAIPIRATTGSL